MDATGEMNVLKLPTSSSSALGSSQLLTAITWTVNPMASIFKDTIAGRTARGFRLLAGSVIPTFSALNAALLLPLAASVVLTVNLPLQTTYAVATLTQMQTIAQLLATIVGLLSIMGAFKVLFQMAEKSQRVKQSWCGKLLHFKHDGQQPFKLTAEPLVEEVVDSVAVIENPTWNSGEWIQFVEDGTLWYVNSITGESTWELPTVNQRRGAEAERQSNSLQFKRGLQQLTGEPMKDVDVEIVREEDSVAAIENPMWKRKEWIEFVEDGTIWYVNSLTGESTWDPPEGFINVHQGVDDSAVVNDTEDVGLHL